MLHLNPELLSRVYRGVKPLLHFYETYYANAVWRERQPYRIGSRRGENRSPRGQPA